MLLQIANRISCRLAWYRTVNKHHVSSLLGNLNAVVSSTENIFDWMIVYLYSSDFLLLFSWWVPNLALISRCASATARVSLSIAGAGCESHVTHCYSLFHHYFYSTLIYFAFSFDEFKRSLTSTSRTLAISSSVSSPGCAVFVHHFETVAGSFPSASASHFVGSFLFSQYNL